MTDPPAWIFPYINWDISPVRPWEWWDMPAGDWIAANVIQKAYRDGQADAQDEHKTRGMQAKDAG